MSDDRLEIRVEAESQKANSELDSLIGKLEELSKTISNSTNSVTQSFGEINKSISQLSSNVSQQTSSFNTAFKGMDGGARRTSQTINKESMSVVKSLTRISAKLYALQRLTKGLSKDVKKAMDYQETVHLFSTVFSRLGSQAGEDFQKGFEERLNKFQLKMSKLGLDPNDLMNYQAMFAQMSNSMGVTAETAYEISESLTSLGADMSALFNLRIEDAMVKLQAGLSGQIRPLRELGIDISKTTIMEEARARGIQKSVEVMTASEKVQLRYLAMMRQASVAHLDMAKTIESPANSLRVLQQQFQQAGRAIGSIFLPAVQKVMPYLMAMAILIQRIAGAIAKFAGYEAPQIKIDFDMDVDDWNEQKKGIEDTEKAAKKLRNQLMGFDEINLWTPPDKGGSKNQWGAGSSFDLSDEIAEQNRKYQEMMDKVMENMKLKGEEIADRIQKWVKENAPLLAMLGALLLGDMETLGWFMDKIRNLFPWLGKVNKGFKDKNKLLGEQTEATQKDTKSVTGLTSSLALLLLGLGALNRFLKDNPFKLPKLEPEVEKEPAERELKELERELGRVPIPLPALIPSLNIESLLNSLNNFQKQLEGSPIRYPAVEPVLNNQPFLQGLSVLDLATATAMGSVAETIISGFADAKEGAISELGELAQALSVSLGENELEVTESYGRLETIMETGQSNINSMVRLSNEETTNFIRSSYLELAKDLDTNWKTHEENTTLVTRNIGQTITDNLVKGITLGGAGVTAGLISIIKNLNLFGGDASNTMGQTGYAMSANYNEGLSSIYESNKNFINSMSDANVQLGNGLAETSAETSNSMVKNFLLGFSSIWDSFLDLMRSMGETPSDKYHEKTPSTFQKALSIAPLVVAGAFAFVNPATIPFIVPAVSAYLPFAGAFAEGGIPEFGQLFIAREAGAELVGGFGNKTAVMNNEQIVESVSMGVYSAIAPLFASGGGLGGSPKEINIILDSGKVATILLPSLDDEAQRMGYETILREGEVI